MFNSRQYKLALTQFQFLLASEDVSFGKLDGTIQILPNSDVPIEVFTVKFETISEKFHDFSKCLLILLVFSSELDESVLIKIFYAFVQSD